MPSAYSSEVIARHTAWTTPWTDVSHSPSMMATCFIVIPVAMFTSVINNFLSGTTYGSPEVGCFASVEMFCSSQVEGGFVNSSLQKPLFLVPKGPRYCREKRLRASWPGRGTNKQIILIIRYCIATSFAKMVKRFEKVRNESSTSTPVQWKQRDLIYSPTAHLD